MKFFSKTAILLFLILVEGEGATLYTEELPDITKNYEACNVTNFGRRLVCDFAKNIETLSYVNPYLSFWHISIKNGQNLNLLVVEDFNLVWLRSCNNVSLTVILNSTRIRPYDFGDFIITDCSNVTIDVTSDFVRNHEENKPRSIGDVYFKNSSVLSAQFESVHSLTFLESYFYSLNASVYRQSEGNIRYTAYFESSTFRHIKFLNVAYKNKLEVINCSIEEMNNVIVSGNYYPSIIENSNIGHITQNGLIYKEAEAPRRFLVTNSTIQSMEKSSIVSTGYMSFANVTIGSTVPLNFFKLKNKGTMEMINVKYRTLLINSILSIDSLFPFKPILQDTCVLRYTEYNEDKVRIIIILLCTILISILISCAVSFFRSTIVTLGTRIYMRYISSSNNTQRNDNGGQIDSATQNVVPTHVSSGVQVDINDTIYEEIEDWQTNKGSENVPMTEQGYSEDPYIYEDVVIDHESDQEYGTYVQAKSVPTSTSQL